MNGSFHLVKWRHPRIYFHPMTQACRLVCWTHHHTEWRFVLPVGQSQLVYFSRYGCRKDEMPVWFTSKSFDTTWCCVISIHKSWRWFNCYRRGSNDMKIRSGANALKYLVGWMIVCGSRGCTSLLQPSTCKIHPQVTSDAQRDAWIMVEKKEPHSITGQHLRS